MSAGVSAGRRRAGKRSGEGAGPEINRALRQLAGWALIAWLLWPAVFLLMKTLRGEVGGMGTLYVAGLPLMALMAHCVSEFFPCPRTPRGGTAPKSCKLPTDDALSSWTAKREGWRRWKPTFVNVVERVRRRCLVTGGVALSILVALVIIGVLRPRRGMTGVWFLWGALGGAVLAVIVLASLVTVASSLLLVVGTSWAGLRSKLRISRRRHEGERRSGA